MPADFAILAEDDSDADALAQIVKQHLNNQRLSIKKKGYDGCGDLRRKGARDIRAWIRQGITRFIVCHDADSNAPEDVHEKVMKVIARPSGSAETCCIAVPVQEIEAWLIADEVAVTSVIPSFTFKGHSNPEAIGSPKEWLIDRSIAENGKPLYSPATFNAAVAKHLRLDVVAKKCPSFRRFLKCLSSFGFPEP